MAAVALVMLALPAFKLQETATAVSSAHGIYLHNDLLARFLEQGYAGRTIMVNDIGEVGWQHQGALVDLWALGSNDVLRAYRDGRMGPAWVGALADRERVPVAATYAGLRDLMPSGWIEVARWRTSPLASAFDLGFYAPTAQDAAQLRQAMQRFAPAIPSDMRLIWDDAGQG
jgi:hypothetical protein